MVYSSGNMSEAPGRTRQSCVSWNPVKYRSKKSPVCCSGWFPLFGFVSPLLFPVSWIIFPGAMDISPGWSGWMWWWDWVASPGTQELGGRKAPWSMPGSEPQDCLLFWSSLAWQTGSSTLESQHYRIAAQRRPLRWLSPTVVLKQSEILRDLEAWGWLYCYISVKMGNWNSNNFKFQLQAPLLFSWLQEKAQIQKGSFSKPTSRQQDPVRNNKAGMTCLFLWHKAKCFSASSFTFAIGESIHFPASTLS